MVKVLLYTYLFSAAVYFKWKMQFFTVLTVQAERFVQSKFLTGRKSIAFVKILVWRHCFVNDKPWINMLKVWLMHVGWFDIVSKNTTMQARNTIYSIQPF